MSELASSLFPASALRSGVCPAHPQTLGVTLRPVSAAACALPRPALNSDHPAALPLPRQEKSNQDTHICYLPQRRKKQTEGYSCLPVPGFVFIFSSKCEERTKTVGCSLSHPQLTALVVPSLAERHIRGASPGDCGGPLGTARTARESAVCTS